MRLKTEVEELKRADKKKQQIEPKAISLSSSPACTHNLAGSHERAGRGHGRPTRPHVCSCACASSTKHGPGASDEMRLPDTSCLENKERRGRGEASGAPLIAPWPSRWAQQTSLVLPHSRSCTRHSMTCATVGERTSYRREEELA